MGTRRQPIQASLLVATFLFAGLSRDSGVNQPLTRVRAMVCEPGQYSVTVTKQGTDPTWTEGTTAHTAVFMIQNGPCMDTYDYTFSATGPISAVTLDKTGSGLGANVGTTVTATYNVDNSGTGQLTLWATGRVGGAVGADFYTVTATIPAGAPVVTAAVPFLEPNYSRCANSCFAAVTARSTVPYISLDAPRQAALVYNSDRGNPAAFVLVNVSPDPNGGTPTEYRLRVLLNGAEVRFLNGEDTLHFTYTGTAPVRLGGQFDASSYATNAYRMEVLVTSVLPGGPVTNDFVTRFISVNQASSAVARGWSFGGIQRLYPQSDGSALVIEGDGSAVYFAKTGTSTFASPAGEFSTLTPSGAGWARGFPDGTSLVFTSAGLMTRALDSFGNRDSVVYDGSNRVSKLIDPLNLAITMTYGTNGLATIQDPQGRVTTVTVDASKRLTSIKDPDSIATTYGYDASLRLSTITDRRGSTSTFGYDTQARTVASFTGSAVPVYGQGNVSPVASFSAWQKCGVPYSATAGSAFHPPPADTICARVTAPGGAVTRFTVNGFGEPLLTLAPLNDTLSIIYTSRGQPTVVKKPGYSATDADTILYNSTGLPTYVHPAGLAATNSRYAAFAQADSIWGTGRPTVRRHIGTGGRVDSVRVAGMTRERFFYNSRGQIDSTWDANWVRTVKNTRAGSNGNLSEALYPGGRYLRYTYDTYGRATSVARSGLATQTIYYSSINRQDSLRNGLDSLPVKFGYDSLLLTRVTDPKGQIYRITYNALGWPTTHIDPAGAVDSVFYTVDGDVRRALNRRHQSIDFAYDSLHRPVSRIGDLALSWTYQNHGRIVTDSSPVSKETAYISLLGSPDSVKTLMASQTYWRRYRYTSVGALDSTETSGGGISFVGRKYGYDTSNGALNMIRINGATTNLSVDNSLQLSSITFPGGDVESRSYNTLHMLMQITSSSGAYDSIIRRGVGFNSAGKISEQLFADTVTSQRYGYDNLGRVTTSSIGHYQTNVGWCLDPDYGSEGPCHQNTVWVATSADTFAYDAAGNRTDHGGVDTMANRITEFDGCSYTTDADGNVTSRTGGSCLKGTATFTWYAEGLLATVTTGGSTIALNYDAAGRLARKDLNGTPQSHFLWDGSNLLAELDSNGTVKRAEYSYYPGLDHLHALVIGSTMYYAHTDAMGNVIALTDASQTTKRTYSFDVWGKLLGGSDNLPFNGYDRARWKGALQLIPELDLYYMRNRWYEGGTGRFLSEDPVGAAGVNAYVYAADDPVNGSDPSGFFAQECQGLEGVACGWAVGGTALEFALSGGDFNAFGNMGWNTNAWNALAKQSLTVWDIIGVAVVAAAGGYEGTVWTSEHGFAPGALDKVEEFVRGSNAVARPGETHIQVGFDGRFKHLPIAVEIKDWGIDPEKGKVIRFRGVWELQSYSGFGAHYILVDGWYEGGRATGTIFVIPLRFTAWKFGFVDVVW